MRRMDRSSACRVVIQVPAYVEQPVEEYHVTSKSSIIVDKDTTTPWRKHVQSQWNGLRKITSTFGQGVCSLPIAMSTMLQTTLQRKKALLLATNYQEMGLTTSPGSPLTRAKKALLLGKQNWSACAVYFFLLIITELVWLNLYGFWTLLWLLACMDF